MKKTIQILLFFFCFGVSFIFSQNGLIKINDIVKDLSGVPVIGANIYEKGYVPNQEMSNIVGYLTEYYKTSENSNIEVTLKDDTTLVSDALLVHIPRNLTPSDNSDQSIFLNNLRLDPS